MPYLQKQKFTDQSENLLRVHVTGGTTGITLDTLKKWKPFTPVLLIELKIKHLLFHQLKKISFYLIYMQNIY